LEVKEEALNNIEIVFQETKQAPSISIVKDSTMMEENMVKSPSKTFSQET
jgi:hypothetical protein